MSSSHANGRTRELDQIEAMAVYILAHFSTAREGRSWLLRIQEVGKVFVRSATPAALGASNLFDVLFQQFPQEEIFKSWRPGWCVMKCLRTDVDDRHLAAICASLLMEGVPVPFLSDHILFELLEKGFVKTADVLVEHGVADVCTMHNGRFILRRAVCVEAPPPTLLCSSLEATTRHGAHSG